MKGKRVLIVMNILLGAILACNLQSGPGTSQPDLVGTITAQAQMLQAATPTQASPGTTAVPVTNTPSVPQVSVTSVTNCRTGPSTAYDLVLTMNPGMTSEIVGKNTPTNYWIIKTPTGGTCWLWGQYAVLSGDTSALPEYPVPPAPPTPTAKATRTPKPSPTSTTSSGSGLTIVAPIIILHPPVGPTNLAQSRTCAGGYASNGITPIWIEVVSLTWTDNATNESGYHIYKGGAQVSTIPANSGSYTITLRYDQGTGGPLYDTFGVEAFNIAGASSRPSLDAPVCP